MNLLNTLINTLLNAFLIYLLLNILNTLEILLFKDFKFKFNINVVK